MPVSPREATRVQIDALMKTLPPGPIPTLLPFLFLLGFKGQPYNLHNHWMFAPLFNLHRPKECLLKCARQVGKSLQMMAQDTLLSILTPYLKTLIVAPLFSQSKRLNDDYVRPLISNTPFRGSFDTSICTHGALRHTYKEHAEQLFSYAFTSVDRIRSNSDIGILKLDEIQGINPDFIPVIIETMSANQDYGFIDYSGTPLTMDNNIETLWTRSSQGEWTIPCKACGKENLSTVKADLKNMIGRTGLICGKASCGYALDPATGFYQHLQPQYLDTFSSYHVPQPIHPIHYKSPKKWTDILHKIKVYPESRLVNEVFGESCDSSLMPVTMAQVRDACSTDPRDVNTLTRASERCLNGKANLVVLAIDWSGGGEKFTSTTTVTVLISVPGSDVLHVAYMERFPKSWTHPEEARRIIEIWNATHPFKLAHDYAGAGTVRETILIQAGIPIKDIIPFRYDCSPRHKIIRLFASSDGSRSCYQIDKTRSLQVFFAAIQAGKVMFPTAASCWDELCDLLNIGMDRMETPRGGDVVFFHRKTSQPDDFIHSTNFAVSSVWYMQRRYPQLDWTVSEEGVSTEELEPEKPDWGVKRSAGG